MPPHNPPNAGPCADDEALMLGEAAALVPDPRPASAEVIDIRRGA